jgi:hypothetical protein
MTLTAETSYKTAIKRQGPSAPLRALLKLGVVYPPVLDYGCGYGADVYHLWALGMDAEGWDTAPDKKVWSAPQIRKYRTVLCTYVLNTLSEKDGLSILDDIQRFWLHRGYGAAYISVRRDLKVDTVSQRIVHLPLEKVDENRNFCIYRLTKKLGSR